MRRHFRFLLLLTLALAMLSPIGLVRAAAPETTQAEESTETMLRGSWIQKDKKYFYQLSDGSILQKTGLQKLDGSWYCLDKDGSRMSGFVKIKGAWYFFKTNGKRYEVPGWTTYKKKTYYFLSDFTAATGARKIAKKQYYFNKKGVLQKNAKPFEYNKKYYRTNKNGVMKKISAAEAKASAATWKFINKYSKSSQSKRTRFRKCFYRLEGYMHYRPGYIKLKELKGSDWPYKCTLKVLNHNVTGNCYGFACTVAAVAKELGYEPYVIVMTCDHAVVQIDGKYYDNMGGGKFGAAAPYHKKFKVYKKVKY